MHTNIDIKSSQFMTARVHSFTLSIHLLNTCHVPDTLPCKKLTDGLDTASMPEEQHL